MWTQLSVHTSFPNKKLFEFKNTLFTILLFEVIFVYWDRGKYISINIKSFTTWFKESHFSVEVIDYDS